MFSIILFSPYIASICGDGRNDKRDGNRALTGLSRHIGEYYACPTCATLFTLLPACQYHFYFFSLCLNSSLAARLAAGNGVAKRCARWCSSGGRSRSSETRCGLRPGSSSTRLFRSIKRVRKQNHNPFAHFIERRNLKGTFLC